MKKSAFALAVCLLISSPSFAWVFGSNYDEGDIPASSVSTSTTNFNGNLSSADNDVQKALDTLDDLVASGGGVAIGDAVTSGTINRVLYEDASNLVAEDADLQFDGTTLLANTVDINGGAIDGTKIGASSAADATFATIRATKIDATQIGKSSATDATFTAITLTTALTTSSGGTGSAAGFALYSPIFAGTSSTGAFQSGSVGATGNLLTSNGASALPTFKSLSTIGVVSGPAVSVDNTLVRFDGTTGKLIQGYTSNGPTASDTGAITANQGGSLTGTWSDMGSVTTIDINGGTIDATKIGASSAADATFATIIATKIDGTKIGTSSSADATFATIRATKMDATRIGTSSAADATFSTVIATRIEGTKIGQVSAADATFSTIRATKIDATQIGKSSATDATFTAITLTTALTTSSGGTGSAAGFALYSPVYAGTASTGAFQSGTLGSAGHVLTSNGNGALPTFKVLGAASLGVGGAIASGSGNRVLYESSGNLLAEDADLTFDGTTLVANTVDINAGAIDGTKIGAASAADATFATIIASKMDATRIGVSSATDATFTALNVSVGSVSTSSGGTGSRGGFSLYSPIFAGTTSTAAFQSGTVGVTGDVLTSNGTGALPTFKAAASGGGSPGGANTYVQFNDSSTFGGDSDLTWNKSTNVLSVNQGSVLFGLGSVGAPDLAFSSATDIGLFQNNAGTISVSVGGTESVRFHTVWVNFPNGSAATPSIVDTSNESIGIYWPNSTSMAVSHFSAGDLIKFQSSGQITLGSSGRSSCLMMRDSDDAGWLECDPLNGVLLCTDDADGVCD